MKFYFLFIFSLLFIFSCTTPVDKNTDQENKKDVVSVNGTVISEDDIEGKDIEEVINNELLFQEALKFGADKETDDQYSKHKSDIMYHVADDDKETLEYLEDYRRKLISDYFIYNMLVNEEDLGEDRIKEYYNGNLYNYINITVDEIIFTDKKLAEEFLDKIKSGQELYALKNAYKENKEIKADFNIINDPFYKKEIYSVGFGEVYDGIIAKNGQFRVVLIREKFVLPYNSLKKNLKSKVRIELGDKKSKELIKQLRNKAEIVYISDNIKNPESPKLNKNAFLELSKNCENIPDSYAKTTCYKPFLQTVVFTNSGAEALSLSKELEIDGVIKDCHLYAHYIGASLLEKHNFDVKKAFHSCSKECIQGCYHGVLEDYISTSNWDPEEVSTRGVELCKSITDDNLLLRQCVHGLGHGLIARKFTPLTNATDICRNIEDPNFQHACLGGVYMEYMDVFLPLSEAELVELVPVVCDETDSLNDIELSSKCYHAVGQGFMFYSGNNLEKSKELCKYVKKEFIEECTNAAEFMASGHHSH